MSQRAWGKQNNRHESPGEITENVLPWLRMLSLRRHRFVYTSQWWQPAVFLRRVSRPHPAEDLCIFPSVVSLCVSRSLRVEEKPVGFPRLQWARSGSINRKRLLLGNICIDLLKDFSLMRAVSMAVRGRAAPRAGWSSVCSCFRARSTAGSSSSSRRLPVPGPFWTFVRLCSFALQYSLQSHNCTNFKCLWHKKSFVH